MEFYKNRKKSGPSRRRAAAHPLQIARFFRGDYGPTSPAPAPSPQGGASPSPRRCGGILLFYGAELRVFSSLHYGWPQRTFSLGAGAVCALGHAVKSFWALCWCRGGKCSFKGPSGFLFPASPCLATNDRAAQKAFKWPPWQERVAGLLLWETWVGQWGCTGNSGRTETEQGNTPPSPWAASQPVVPQEGALLCCSGCSLSFFLRMW